MKIRYLLISLFAISLTVLSCMAQEPEVLVEPVQKEVVKQYGFPSTRYLIAAMSPYTRSTSEVSAKRVTSRE